MTTTPAPMDEKAAKEIVANHKRGLFRWEDNLRAEGYLQALEDERKRSGKLVLALKGLVTVIEAKIEHDSADGWKNLQTNDAIAHDLDATLKRSVAALKDYEGRTLGEKEKSE